MDDEFLDNKNIERKTPINFTEMLEESTGKDLEEEFLTYNYEEETTIDYLQIFKSTFLLGCVSFGGQSAQQELIKERFVKDKKYISEKHFQYILDLCLVLPGYSSTQFIAAIMAIKTKNLMGALVAFLGFNSPSLLAILLFSLIMKTITIEIHSSVRGYHPDTANFKFYHQPFLYSLMVIGAGICQGALAILIHSTYNLSKKLSNSLFQIFLLSIAAILYYLFDDYLFMLIVLVLCGFASAFKGDHDYLLDQTEVRLDIKNIRFIGLPCLIILIFIFIVISILSYMYTNIYILLIESFLRIGSLSFGEGHMIIPLMLTEYTSKNIIEEAEILNGYALMSLLPGPMFNLAGYVGVLVGGVLSGILSAFVIFIPGFLIIFSALPYISNIKNSYIFQYFIRGVHSAAIGFILTSCYKLWIDSCFVNPYTNAMVGTINVLLCYILAENFKVHKTYIVIFGALFLLINTYAKAIAE